MNYRIILTSLLCLCASAFAAQEVKVLNGFEQDGDLKFWEFKKGSAAISDQHVTQGAKSTKITSDEYMITFRKMDWSGFESLDLDVFVEGGDPVGVSLLIADEDWNKKKDYWNRHNGGFILKPGANTLSIPVNGLFRGEAGSRGNDLKTNINPKEIIRLDIGFQAKGKPATLYVDNMRLNKESRPEGILAYDFGPKSQVVFPGFTPISYDTVYGKDGAKAGLKEPRPSAYQARDDLFPTRLYQDCVVLDWGEFVVDVPNGKYNVWLMYNDCGYWGGEQARFSKRWIDAEGQRAWGEERADGAADYLYHFENIEPKPSDSLWDLYVNYQFTPKRFQVDVKDGQLNLRFGTEGFNGSKVAALIVYPESKKTEAEAWVKEIEARNRMEFESRAVFVGAKKLQSLYAPGSGNADIQFPSLDGDGTFINPPTLSLQRSAARGQNISFTFNILWSNAKARVKAVDLSGPGGVIPANEMDVRFVQQATQRGYNDIAYTIEPESLRRIPEDGVTVQRDAFPRQIWVTVHVPENAKAGTYTGTLVVSRGDAELKVPLSVNVLDIVLDEPNYLMGFYGIHVPEDLPAERKKTALRELFTLLKQYGMNALSGGPGIRFSGFDADGKPKLDFAACDEYFKTAHECGFTRACIAYGGPAMVSGLHDGYVIGETGRGWEKKTGKPFGELLKIVWGAVKEHGEKNNWPEVYYSMCDEPRVLEHVTPLVECMKAYRDNVPFVKIGGSYSVHWGDKPFDKAVQEIFKTLHWSALNLHAQVDLDKAKEFGREMQIYNQGTSRYSFGAYQWAEFRKGVTARMQWHLLALHGYQFFDLDGREPDTAMINWGRNEIIPTVALARCREGADDFRFAVTLWNLAEKNKARPEAKAAQAWLNEVGQKIGVNQAQRPKDFMDDETFRNTCIEHIQKIKAAR